MKILAIILLFGTFGVARYHSEPVDLIELNHFYDQKGKWVYDQMIFWENTPTTGKFQVRGWALCEGCYPVTFDGITKFENKDYRVSARLFRESWTQRDPERENKKFHPEELRNAIPKKNPTEIKPPTLLEP